MTTHDTKLSALTLRYNADLLEALHKHEEMGEASYDLSLSADGWVFIDGKDMRLGEAHIAMQDALFREKVREIRKYAQLLLEPHSSPEVELQAAADVFKKHVDSGYLLDVIVKDERVLWLPKPTQPE